MRGFIKILLAVVLICIVVVPSYAQRNVREAIVKIYTVYTKHDYDMPWQLLRQGRKYGSGCIISDKRILTNAHVVANQTFIQVKRAGQAKKYTAKVEIVDHNCDLAVLRVADDSFFSGAEPLQMGTLPKMGDRVAVYGFPMGGDELCITEGVLPLLVPGAGIEPARGNAPRDFKSLASTSSAIQAYFKITLMVLKCQGGSKVSIVVS